jgi:dimethylargininase
MLPMAHENRYPEVERFARQLLESGIVADVDTRMQSHADAAVIVESSPLVRGYPAASASASPGIASVDGGDVMWTGQELVIGISSRTSLRGAAALAATHGCPTLAVDLTHLQKMHAAGLQHASGAASSEVLHLKSLVSMLSPNRLVSWGQPLGSHLTGLINSFRVWRREQAPAAGTGGDAVRQRSGLSSVFLPTDRASAGIAFPRDGHAAEDGSALLLDCVSTSSALAANVVSANGFVMRQTEMPVKDAKSIDQSAQKDGLDVLAVDMSELAKVDGALTCCSVLFPEAR